MNIRGAGEATLTEPRVVGGHKPRENFKLYFCGILQSFHKQRPLKGSIEIQRQQIDLALSINLKNAT